MPLPRVPQPRPPKLSRSSAARVATSLTSSSPPRAALVFPRAMSAAIRRDDGVSEQEAGHAWAEAFVPKLGWVAFDAANGLCATDAHVRVAVGLDDLGAAPLRGTRYGGVGEALSVKVRVEQAAQQTQN